MLALVAGSAQAALVTIQFNLRATSGSQFGVTAPATLSGTFKVDSAFLAQANGNYGGSAISLLNIQVGSQLFNQTTAFDPNIQGIRLTNHMISGIALNWKQTSAGLGGPFIQSGIDGVFFIAASNSLPGPTYLQGPAGSQSFELVPAPGAAAILGLGGLMVSRRRR